jgi:hypothetical protein
MAAEFEDLETVVMSWRCLLGEGMGELGLGEFALAPALVAPDLVDEPASRASEQPGARVLRCAFGGPLLVGGEQGVLDRVLAQVELAGAVATEQRAEDLRRQGAQQVLGCFAAVQISAPAENITGRISSARPSMRASGMRWASSTARSFDSTSSR